MNFTRFFFEDILLDQGFAVVYFDKRGVESSEGVWYNTTFEQRALDARNIALEVGRFDFIDKDDIYLIGHSQGGWIVQIAVGRVAILRVHTNEDGGVAYITASALIKEIFSRAMI